MKFSKFLLIALFGVSTLSATSTQKEVVKLDLDNLVQEVVKKNSKALVELISVQIKDNELKAEESIFEPIFSTSFTQSKQDTKTSPEDSYYDLLNNSGNIYVAEAKKYDMGFSGLLQTGGSWELKAIQNSLDSNVIQRRGFESENRTYLKLALEQPLLKNAGFEITDTKTKLAKINTQITRSEYEKTLTELVGVTIQTYWQLYGAKRVLQSWENLVDITIKNLENVKILANSGKIPQTEILEIENRLYLIQLQKIEAKDKVIEKTNQLLSLLNVPVSNYQNVDFELTESINSQSKVPTLKESYEKALENWSEYDVAKKRLEFEQVSKKYVDNQLLPDLKLKGEVTNQSLEEGKSKSLQAMDSDEYQDWSVGLIFSMPIFGNERMENYSQNARLNILKSKLELNSLEKNLNNSLDTRIEKLKNTKEQMELFQKALETKKTLLEIENEKLLLGKGSAKTVLEEEEKYIEHQRKMYERLIEWKTAEAVLQKVMGTLLQTYKIQVDTSDLDKKVYNNSFSDDIKLK